MAAVDTRVIVLFLWCSSLGALGLPLDGNAYRSQFRRVYPRPQFGSSLGNRKGYGKTEEVVPEVAHAPAVSHAPGAEEFLKRREELLRELDPKLRRPQAEGVGVVRVADGGEADHQEAAGGHQPEVEEPGYSLEPIAPSGGQPDAHLDRQPEEQLNRQTEVQLNKQPELHLSRQPEVHLNRQPEVQLNRQPDAHLFRLPVPSIAGARFPPSTTTTTTTPRPEWSNWSAERAKYSFTSQQEDGISDLWHARSESRDNGTVMGSYSYSDGYVLKTVHYVADKDGYRIVGETGRSLDGPNVNPLGKAAVKAEVDGQGYSYVVHGEDLLRRQAYQQTRGKLLGVPPHQEEPRQLH